jgi:DNA-binding NtrC family response regulator
MHPTPLLGVSPATECLRREIEFAARTDAKVLIVGETGVGKDVVAQLIHHGSRTRTGPFVTINCAGVPETLLESEFFGHARGSFTDAYRDHPGLLRQGHRGTVFLDEIGEMTPRLQGLLLRFLETGEVHMIGGPTDMVDVRIIAATNRDLAAETGAGGFRLDLFYRLNVMRVEVPPLRDRREDVPVLVEHFLQACAEEQHRAAPPSLTQDAMAALTAYRWPGNVRQLRNVVERIVVRAASPSVDVCDLPTEVAGKPAAPARPSCGGDRVEMLWRRLLVDRESFWTAVYPTFKSRELTREELRVLIAVGLTESRGYYRALLSLFNMPGRDYKRFMNFLTAYDCKLPSQPYRMTRGTIDISVIDRVRAR